MCIIIVIIKRYFFMTAWAKKIKYFKKDYLTLSAGIVTAKIFKKSYVKRKKKRCLFGCSHW